MGVGVIGPFPWAFVVLRTSAVAFRERRQPPSFVENATHLAFFGANGKVTFAAVAQLHIAF